MSADQLVKGVAAARSRGLDERAVGIHWRLDLPEAEFIPSGLPTEARSAKVGSFLS
jgi:hypothetical protein